MTTTTNGTTLADVVPPEAVIPETVVTEPVVTEPVVTEPVVPVVAEPVVPDAASRDAEPLHAGEDRSLQLDRGFTAEPERIWRALTDPAALTAWFWPPALAPLVSLDPRVGGAWCIESVAQGLAVRGEYAMLLPPELLVFTWRWDGESEQTLVTIELRGDANASRLHLTHERFASESGRDRHITGWTQCLDRLPAYLAVAAGAGRGR